MSTFAGVAPGAAAQPTRVPSGPAADLSVFIAKKSDFGPVAADGDFGLNVHVTNNGPDAATNVVLTLAFPVSAHALSPAGECALVRPVTCSLGTVAVGANVKVVVSLEAIAPGPVTTTASATSDLSDPDLANNSDSQTVKVRGVPGTRYVTVADTTLSDSTVSVPQGETVQWNFLGTADHDVTDTTGLGLFASGPEAPGSFYRHTFFFAGGYSYASEEDSSSFRGIVKVAPVVSPPSGTTAMDFPVVWSRSTVLPCTCVFDVQIQRSGGGYFDYLRGTDKQSLSFAPDAGNGGYRFRVRLRTTASHAASAYVTSNSLSVGAASPLQWVHQVGSPKIDEGNGIAVDSNGNSYVTGDTLGTIPGSPESSAGGYDAFVAKFDVGGNLLWVHELGSTGDDSGRGIAVDADGNAFITGVARGTLPGSAKPSPNVLTVFVAKYDTNGNRQWVRQFHSSDYNVGEGIAVDQTGNVYIGGVTDGTLAGSPEANQGGTDAFVAKYNTNGGRLWVHELGGTTDDAADAIAVDGDGSAYLTGTTDGTLAGSPDPNVGNSDVFVAKYDTDGNRQWVHQLGSSNNDGGTGIAVDGHGNAYVTGATYGTLPGSLDANAGEEDVFVAKYDTSGNRQWVRQLGGPGYDVGHGIAADSSGNVFVTGQGGTLPGSTETGDLFVVKYDTNGNLQTNGNRQWVHRLGSGNDVGAAIATDPDGNPHIAGTTDGTLPGSPDPYAGRTDVFVVKYLSQG